MTRSGCFQRRPDGERGAVLILSAVGLAIALLSAAMAVDVGSVIWRKRDLQVVADLAAQDAAQTLGTLPAPTDADAQVLAEESAARNDFDFVTAGNGLSAVVGTFDPATGFTPTTIDPNAVQVTAAREVPYTFVPGSNTVTVKAVAEFTNVARAAFSIGSSLATFDASNSTILGPLLTTILGTSPAVSASILSYQGLAASTVTLGDVATQLGFASVDDLMTGSATVGQLAQASANLLNADGETSADVVTLVGQIGTSSDAGLDFAFADIFDIAAGDGDAAASVGFNVFDMLTSAGQAAQIANGTTFLTVPLTASIPSPFGGSLVSSTLNLDLIQPPVVSAFGPVGTTASTAQMGLTLTSRIRVASPPVLGISALDLDLTLPVDISAAGGTGEITAIDCLTAPPPDTPVDLTVDTEAATAAATAATLTAKLAGVPLPGGANQPVASTGPVSVPAATGEVLTFPGLADSVPMTFPSEIQTVPGTGLPPTFTTDLVNNLQLGLLGVPVGPALSLLTPVTDQIDALILNPVLDALGLTVGGADLRTLAVQCVGSGGRLVA
ncbi:MAG TPA: TadG family pilus assembly protein [Acidimicrobiales bacterium]|nr:TadG family pilus assembly protein [Acidimicrobiales bacterium]